MPGPDWTRPVKHQTNLAPRPPLPPGIAAIDRYPIVRKNADRVGADLRLRLGRTDAEGSVSVSSCRRRTALVMGDSYGLGATAGCKMYPRAWLAWSNAVSANVVRRKPSKMLDQSGARLPRLTWADHVVLLAMSHLYLVAGRLAPLVFTRYLV
ncbi:hypothetical protein LX32DRAFT_641519 [Colletotrichum zoysiae]|uniref:Uncharacterized protein n=1 Tax=Colletotrichum zoysiae TaxID=1216348 RepID=A0AAD9HDH8_9PEZI|nr:hypothetical protein LX32DRAFT_641519 [Colletotrichum zoysiae]